MFIESLKKRPSSEKRSGVFGLLNLPRKQKKNQQTGNPVSHRVDDGKEVQEQDFTEKTCHGV